MTSLRKILEKYSDSHRMGTAPLGKDEILDHTSPALSFEKDAFLRDLELARRENRWYFLLCVVMVVVLFSLLIMATVRSLLQPGLAMATFGVSTVGVMNLMLKLWRTKTIAEFLMLLARNVDAETAKTIVNILARLL